MKKILRFIRQYQTFIGAALGAIVALVLTLTKHHTAAHWVLIIVSSLETIPMIVGMVNDLREGKYGVDILAVTAVITAVVMRQYWTSIVIVLMFTGGRALERYAEHRARIELDALLSRAPQYAHVIRSRKEIDVLASEVRVGDTVVIRPGEVVPVDTRVVEGTASFDESSLTGESLPRVHKPDSVILSGSIDQDSAITAEAIHTAADSQYEQIIQLVKSAAKSQAPFVRLADKYAIPFTIISFTIAGIAWILSKQSIRFLDVLVVATPCPLILAAPIAVISGMSRSSKHGIIIKTGTALEKLATAETFAFDKTGTLTKGEPEVDKIITFAPFKVDEILGLAAGLEQQSNHVLARAILKRAAAKQIKPAKAKHVKELAGNGLSAQVSAKQVLVGRLSMFEEYDITLPERFKSQDIQATAAFVAVGGKLAGIITFKDELRNEAKTTITGLLASGVKQVLMITGDNKHVARTIARKLGITDYYAEALPADKIRVLEQVVDRPVAFVGDGVNDAPALTASDIGIALGARGSTAASESADVVIMLDGFNLVAEARAIARRTFSIAKQSILIGIVLSIGFMFVFATGKFQPIYGAVIQEVVDVIVIFNALRAHGSFKKTQA